MEIQVGDKVLYTRKFGRGVRVEAEVETIELTPGPHMTDGIQVEVAHDKDIYAGKVVLTLSDNRWCYGQHVVEVLS